MYIQRLNVNDGKYLSVFEDKTIRIQLGNCTVTIIQDGNKLILNKSNSLDDRITIMPEGSNVIVIK